MAAVTICSDFGAQKNKVWHCFHCFPIPSNKNQVTGKTPLTKVPLASNGTFFHFSAWLLWPSFSCCFFTLQLQLTPTPHAPFTPHTWDTLYSLNITWLHSMLFSSLFLNATSTLSAQPWVLAFLTPISKGSFPLGSHARNELFLPWSLMILNLNCSLNGGLSPFTYFPR